MSKPKSKLGRNYGWKRQKPDFRDKKYPKVKLLKAITLPSKVDLSKTLPAAYDQSVLGSCTGNAIGAAHHFNQIKQVLPDIWTPSRLFIYYGEREMEGTIAEDAGAEIRDGIKFVARSGVCPECMWPYDIAKFTHRPTTECYDVASKHTVASYMALDNTDINQLKQCLAEGYPFVFGFAVYESFESTTVKDTGMMPIPNKDERLIGGHAVTCLAGDTKIPLLNGTNLSINELLEKYGENEFWVYSCDDTGKIVPGRAHSLRKTGTDKQIVEILLDNNKKIKCTPDHLILMRDGTYMPAEKLKNGDSLMPLYRKNDECGYEMVLHQNNHTWQYTHRLVAAKDEKYIGVVHHSDFNKKNNSPENLLIMSWDDHTELHAKNNTLLNNYATSDKGREKSRKIMNDLWKNPEFRKKMQIQNSINGKKTCEKLKAIGKCGIQKWTIEERTLANKKSAASRRGLKQSQESKNKAKLTLEKRWNEDLAYRKNKQNIGGNNWRKYAEKLKNGKLKMTEKQKNARIQNMHKLTEKLKINPLLKKMAALKAAWTRFHKNKNTFTSFDEYLKSKNIFPNNHKVIAVNIVKNEDVYDLTVDKYHNFAVDAGVFVHNCVGYDDSMKCFIIRNSWGKEWGKDGHFFMPYSVITNPDMAADFWTIRLVNDDGKKPAAKSIWQILFGWL